MTQMESTCCSTPARRRALSTPTVLIRVPALAGVPVGASTMPARRRRLRREVRIAGAWLLALIPPTMACATWGGTRPAPLLAVNSPTRAASTVAEPVGSPRGMISLSLEPVAPAQRPERGSSVVLSGQLLPADAFEEPTHGGY